MSTELTPEQEKQVQERLHEQETKMTEQFSDMLGQQTSWILKMMKDHFGEEAYQVFAKVVREINRQHWSKIVEESGDNSIEALIKHCWGAFSSEDLEYTTEETESGFHITCTKCSWHETAKRLEITEQMFYAFCECDPECDPFAVEDFNPNIGLKRTKTLMQGDDCCDFFYYYKDKAGNLSRIL